jgi:hypothetical protein
LKHLEYKKRKFLEDKEVKWRLKSRDTWLELGDENTKYFHKFSNHWKNINTIWEMTNEEGVVVRILRT